MSWGLMIETCQHTCLLDGSQCRIDVAPLTIVLCGMWLYAELLLFLVIVIGHDD